MIEGFVYEGNTVHFDLYIERQDRIDNWVKDLYRTCNSEVQIRNYCCFFVVVSNKNNSGIPVWIVGRPWWSWDLKSWLLFLRFFLVVQVLAFIILNWLMFASFSVLLISFTGFSGYVYSEHCYWSLISFYWSSWYILPSILLIFFTGVDLSGYVYADNYFELFYNGQFIVVTLLIAKADFVEQEQFIRNEIERPSLFHPPQRCLLQHNWAWRTFLQVHIP